MFVGRFEVRVKTETQAGCLRSSLIVLRTHCRQVACVPVLSCFALVAGWQAASPINEQKRRSDCSKRRFRCPYRTPKYSKRLAIFTCTRYSSPFCIPKRLCGEMHLRSAPEKAFACSLRARRPHGAIRFLFWWLFLHRRLRSRQTRLNIRRYQAALHSSGLIKSRERYPFLSE